MVAAFWKVIPTGLEIIQTDIATESELFQHAHLGGSRDSLRWYLRASSESRPMLPLGTHIQCRRP